MANFIPRLVFGPEPPLDLVFDTPPEGDPQNETLGTEKEQVRSVGGQLFTSDFYDYRTFTLRFILQSNATALKLKRLFEDYALKGESFIYFPHSDDNTIKYGVELESETVTFNRDHPDGQDGFLWSFEFTLINVTKTAPRITREGTQRPSGDEPGPVQNFRATNISSESATLNWDAPEQAAGSDHITKYEIRRGEDGPIVDITTDGGLTGFAYYATGLTATTEYTYYIRALGDDGLEGPWVSVTFTTTADAPTISEVRNLTTTSIGTTTASISWDAPANGSNLTGYDVEITQPITRSASSTNTEHDFTNLAADTRYIIRVRAKTATLNGPWATLEFRTAQVSFSRDFYGNRRRSSDNDFVYTGDFGDLVDPYSGLQIDLSDRSHWTWTGNVNPNYAYATTSTRQVPLRGFTLSTTDTDEMGILANLRSINFTFAQQLLILKKSGNNFVPYRFIHSSGILQDIAAVRMGSSGNYTNRYVYVKWGDSYVYASSDPHVNDERYWFKMTHYSQESDYENSGCCIVNNVYLYVADFRGGKIHCYDLRTRARVTSRDIDIRGDLFPRTMYSNSRKIWTISAHLNKMVCYDIRSKTRCGSGREFNVGALSTSQGVFALNDHFAVGTGTGIVGFKI